jgi:hypothetical protein
LRFSTLKTIVSQKRFPENEDFAKNRFFIFPKTFLGFPFLLYFGEEFGNAVKSRVFSILYLEKSQKTFPKTAF